MLGDPLLRAQYDRELDGGPAGWDEVDWGVEVGASEHPGADPGGAGDGGRFSDPQRRDFDAYDPPIDLSRLDAFVGPPRRIPDPLLEVRTEVPSLKPSSLEKLAALVAWVLGVATTALLVTAGSRGAWAGRDVASAMGEDGVSAAMAWVSVCVFAVLLHALSPRRSRGALAAWVFTWLAASMGLALVDGVTWERQAAGGLVAASVATAVGAVVVAVTWARAFAGRRLHPDRIAALWHHDTSWRLDRYRRAVEWNRVRLALLRPGTVAVVVGPGATDRATGEPVPGMRWAFDPRTGIEAVRLVSGDVPLGWWLVFDDEDRVVASAPAGAPEAWLSALREAPARSAAQARA